MNAGSLRYSIKIQQKNVTRDSFGAETIAWTDVATVWAAIEPLQGREFFNAQQVNAEVTTRIRVRYRSGVTPAMRMLLGSRVFDIQSVINLDERNRELHLMCKEVV